MNIQKEYLFNNQLRPYSEAENIKPNINIHFKNIKENKLGIALPKGVIRLYQKDQKGNLIFLGEDRINHTGNLEEVSLNMGTAFDISANAKLIKNKEKKEPIGQNRIRTISEKTYEITLKNGTKSPVTVNIREDFGNNAKMIEESLKSDKKTANRFDWSVSIPAEGESKLTYTIKEEF